jgi:hypothetical protein
MLRLITATPREVVVGPCGCAYMSVYTSCMHALSTLSWRCNGYANDEGVGGHS